MSPAELLRGLAVSLVLGGCGLYWGDNGAPVVPAVGGVVLVTPSGTIGQTCEVLAVLDLPTDRTTVDAAFEVLREGARAVGGQAVVAARFVSAHDDEPARVSGVVVKLKPADDRPFDVIAEVDVQTDADAPDKGVAALQARARELGADKLVDVRFDRGETGVSHLRARAVKLRR